MSKNRRSTEFRNSSQVIDMEEARKERQKKRQAERAKEEEKARRAQKNSRKTAIRKKRGKQRLVIAAVIVVVIAMVGLSVFNIISLKLEQKNEEAHQTELKEEKTQLQKQLENVKDKDNLEEQARSQLRLIKPGESLYIFDDYLTNEDNNTDETDESGSN